MTAATAVVLPDCSDDQAWTRATYRSTRKLLDEALRVRDYDAIFELRTAAEATTSRAAREDMDLSVRVDTEALVRYAERTTVLAILASQRAGERGSHAAFALAIGLIVGAYGDSGLDAHIIDAFGMITHRYSAEFDDKVAVDKLSNALGGLNGLTNKAAVLKNATGQSMSQCVASAAVEIYNQKNRHKIAPWWASNGVTL
jgi:hypothetical protein